MGCSKCLTILFSVLVLIKGLAGLLIGILSLTPIGPLLALLLLALTLGFTNGVKSLGSNVSTLDLADLATAVTLFYVIIAVGALGLFVGIWGIVAAAKGHRCMLTTAAVILFVLLAAEVIITAFSGVGYGAFTSRLTKAEFDKTSGGIKGTYMDNAQANFKCCGIDGPADYIAVIPDTCCIADDIGVVDKANCQLKVEGFIYMDGCGQYKGQIPGVWWTPLGILIGACVITLFTFIITIAFCCTLRKDEYA